MTIGVKSVDDIINLLKTNEKMTSSVISKRLNISLPETIKQLLDLEKKLFLSQLNGFWFTRKTMKADDTLSANYYEIVKETGAMSAAEIALITGSTSSSVAHYLSKYVRNGEMIRYRKDCIYLYAISYIK